MNTESEYQGFWNRSVLRSLAPFGYQCRVEITPTRCPADPEEVSEAYYKGTLGRADAAAFEEHYLVCKRCSAVMEDMDRYVRAMQTAARRLRG